MNAFDIYINVLAIISALLVLTLLSAMVYIVVRAVIWGLSVSEKWVRLPKYVIAGEDNTQVRDVIDCDDPSLLHENTEEEERPLEGYTRQE